MQKQRSSDREDRQDVFICTTTLGEPDAGWSAPSVGYSIVKRSIDLATSLFMLLALMPVMVLIAVAIKLTSDGPVFYRQQRIGYREKPFDYWKFRTMRIKVDANLRKEYIKKLISGADEPHPTPEAYFALRNDPRITSIGRFLRRTSLDELPLLFNVLSGDLSLVGPRPAEPYELSSSYGSAHKLRLSCKPGITCIWQVSGRSSVSFDDMVRMDLEYAKRHSIWLDIKILLKTPAAVFRDTGSY